MVRNLRYMAHAILADCRELTVGVSRELTQWHADYSPHSGVCQFESRVEAVLDCKSAA
jgi:hypothetical protein